MRRFLCVLHVFLILLGFSSSISDQDSLFVEISARLHFFEGQTCVDHPSLRTAFEKCVDFLSILLALPIFIIVIVFVSLFVVCVVGSECLGVSKRALQVFPAETMVDGLPPASSTGAWLS